MNDAKPALDNDHELFYSLQVCVADRSLPSRVVLQENLVSANYLGDAFESLEKWPFAL